MRLVLSALLLLGLAACGAGSTRQTTHFLGICSDPGSAPADALRFCTRALENRDLDNRQRALIRMNIGIANYSLGRYRDAVVSHGEALALLPGLAGAHLGRAEAYEALGDDRSALRDYTAAIGAEPGRATAWFGRGVLLRKVGRPDEALRDLDRALALEPDWKAAFFERGSARFALGRYAEAEADFSAVLAREPGDAAARLNRAQARSAQGAASAGDDFDRAIAAAPEWGKAYAARAAWHDANGRTDAANADYIRAFQLGATDPAIIERVRRISGG